MAGRQFLRPAFTLLNAGRRPLRLIESSRAPVSLTTTTTSHLALHTTTGSQLHLFDVHGDRMTATKIDGTAIAKEIRASLNAEIKSKQEVNPRYKPCLKIIQGRFLSITLYLHTCMR
jgi:hypothetical protein